MITLKYTSLLQEEPILPYEYTYKEEDDELELQSKYKLALDLDFSFIKEENDAFEDLLKHEPSMVV